MGAGVGEDVGCWYVYPYVNEKLQGQGKKGKLAGFRQCSLNDAAGAETKENEKKIGVREEVGRDQE